MQQMAIFREFAQAAGPLAVAALWQGAVLALGLAACVRLTPRVSAADRFRAWAAGFAALVALPFLPMLVALHFGTNPGAIGSAAPAANAWLDLDPRWGWAIAGLWLAASVVRALDLTVHALRLRNVWKRALPMESAGAGFEVCATRELDRPSVIGFFRPRILIPEWLLLARLTSAELEQVILHEAEHLRRRDDWTNLLQKLALVVFPLNPGLAWMERQLCHEREMACDDAVVRATGKPRAYAACLTSLAERGLEKRREALSLGAWRQRPELVGRVHRLLKRGPGLSPAAARALLAVVGCGVVFGSVEFARAPQLVAFVAAPVIAQSNTPDLVNASFHADGRAMAGYRAMNAVAHVPSRAELASERSTNAANQARLSPTLSKGINRKSEVRNVLTETPASQPGSSLVVIETPAMQIAGASLRSAQPTAKQWIVLAAWEQVVTVRRHGSLVSDYDASQTDAGVSANSAAPVQWTITRLILHVEPAQTDSGDATQDGLGSDTNLAPAQPAAIPLHDGWLVLQL